MRFFRLVFMAAFGAALMACSAPEKTVEETKTSENCPVELIVLGVGQDAGAPQIGNPGDPAWKDPSKRLYATSLGLLDHENGKRYLFEATPDIRKQMQVMDEIMPPDGEGPYIDGVFITHAHIGHYAGLMFLGRESMGAKGVPVYVLPRMKKFLENNGPWSQLVELGNIEVYELERDAVELPKGLFESFEKQLSENVSIIAEKVPHRDEFSETAAFLIDGPRKNLFFVPDIDSWEEWEAVGAVLSDDYSLGTLVKVQDFALLDATFYDDNELPGRDMSKIPHPRVTESMDLIDAAGDETLKNKVRFIHINHTNPLRDRNSDAFYEMTTRGYELAYRGERFCL